MSTRLLANRYELLEKIGDGGMAVVYKARCRLLNRFVAIKILKPEYARNAKFIENFRRESQAAASLSHPHIVSIYDVGREGNIHYIVMELIEGHILSDLIEEKGPLDWKGAVEIAKQISSALAFAHKNHIIHRDVKPHNILLTAGGTAKITDFGIARALNSTGYDEETQTVMGSVHYFSPEQARGGYVDEKSDIYSLGIVLFEILTGKVPFDGENPVSVALMHINDPMPRPSEFMDGIPTQIEEVIMKATDKLQTNRYKSADEMYDALAHAEFDAMMSQRAGGAASATAISQVDTENEADALEYNESNEEFESEDKDLIAAEESGKKSKKKEKSKNNKEKKPLDKVLIGAVVAAIVVAIPVSMLLSRIFLGGNAKSFEVPDFRGMTLESAQEVASEYKLKIEENGSVYSSEYELDTICSQNPDVKEKVKEGKTIKVTISKGIKEGTVPNLVGKSKSDAEYALKKYGYKVGSVTEEANSLPAGIVISQSPAGGEEVKPGSYVSFVVSTGTAAGEGIVPLLLGKTESEAKTLLEAVGLKLGSISTEKSSTYPEGQVIWQSAEAKSTLAAGSAVNVKISAGENSNNGGSLQNPSSIYVSYDKAANDVFWLTVTISDESGMHNVITRSQRLKADGGENVPIEGVGKGTVTVVFDNTVVEQHSVDFGTGN